MLSREIENVNDPYERFQCPTLFVITFCSIVKDLVSLMCQLLFSELVGREGELFHSQRLKVLVVLLLDDKCTLD
jgi:hypothetical protein